MHACTDITGFSLIGHALEIAKANKGDFSLHTLYSGEALGMRNWA